MVETIPRGSRPRWAETEFSISSTLGTSRFLPRRSAKRSGSDQDRKSTRLNSSHMSISYAVFCLKKKKKNDVINDVRDEEESHFRLLGTRVRSLASHKRHPHLEMIHDRAVRRRRR